MAVFRFGLICCLFVGACDFGINTTGLAGEGGSVPDTGSDAVEETAPPVDVFVEPIDDSGPARFFGDPNVEPNQDNVLTNDPDGYRYQATAGGAAQTVFVYVDSQTSGASFDVGIYDDEPSTTPPQPKGLLAFATFSSPSSGWVSQTLSSSITVTNGSFYWIVVHPTTGTLFYRNAGSSGGGIENVSANNASLPTTWSSVDNATDGPASMYVAP